MNLARKLEVILDAFAEEKFRSRLSWTDKMQIALGKLTFCLNTFTISCWLNIS